MSEAPLDHPLDEPLLFNPNEPFSPSTLSFESGGDRVTVSMPTVGFPMAIAPLAAFVGKSLAGGILGSVGGKIFSKAMSAIGIGGDGVADALKEINERLDRVEKAVAEVKALCEEILSRLETLQTVMEQSMLEGRLGPAFSTIRAAYGNSAALRADHIATTPISAPTFMELLNSLPSLVKPEELKLYADAFLQAANGQWALRTQIATIGNVLTKATGQSKSLLNRWAQALIVAVGKKELSLDSAYKTLEGYFLQAVSEQLTAVAMHCFVLGSDPNPEARLKSYLEDDFAAIMSAQTDEFLHAVERLMFSQVVLGKVPSIVPMTQASGFPNEMESLFLRADLLCAALNLVGNKRSVASPRLAIIGIYGRCLARPSNIVDGKGPEIAIADLTASHGTVCRPMEFLKPVDLRRDGDRLILEDVTKSGPVIVRYFLPWKEALPAQGSPLNTNYRGGVVPAFYNVFADQEWPLAASFVDIGPLLQGAPADAPAAVDFNDLFPTDNPHTVIHQTTFVPCASHPLVKPVNNEIAWVFDHATKANGAWKRTTAFLLFKYAGAEAPMRLHADVFCETKNISRIKPYHSDIREIDLNTRLLLVHRPMDVTHFYNSSEEQGKVLDLNNRPAGYGASVESKKTLDFTIKPGEYSLHLDFQQWIGKNHPNFKNWESDSLKFILKGLFLEWL